MDDQPEDYSRGKNRVTKCECKFVREDIVAGTASPLELFTVAETKSPCESTVGSSHTLRSDVFQTRSRASFSEDDNVTQSDDESLPVDVSSINLEDIDDSVDKAESTQSVNSDGYDRLTQMIKDIISNFCEKESALVGDNTGKKALHISDKRLVDEILDKVLQITGTDSGRRDQMLHQVSVKQRSEQCQTDEKTYRERQTQTRHTEYELFDKSGVFSHRMHHGNWDLEFL